MLKDLFAKTPAIQNESKGEQALYSGLCVLIALAMGLAASGSGNPETVEPLPDWINIGSNALCVLIGLMVLVPRTRLWGALAAALMMLVSMATNYAVDGRAYFLQVLPFNVITLAVALIIVRHHWADLGQPNRR